MSEYSFQPVGSIESCYLDRFGTPRQPGLAKHAWAKIKMNPEWQPEISLQGLEAFSHLWVIFVFHQNTNSRFHAKIHPPRMGGDSIGAFATRSPHRPNPVGLSLVKIEKVGADFIEVSGGDFVTGTPVLDIKPYLPEIESVPHAVQGWTQKVSGVSIAIQWTDEALKSLSLWQAKVSGRESLKALIEETIALDPRPQIYKGYEGQESPYRERHAIRFFEGDVHFRFLEPTKVEIFNILSLNNEF
ncbi:MAG: tRNA (N6-threonylcarbamoyladenosine(37)-N6)-methyltransferase TrmO [Proteobacteria bacterium]|jgi:tRNA-Thr(GGU) m(6)t(6)A37 methyltransferase TsaA|nr:tRNA (N6-threonylcarbamoyladenosine(37)-N6)-methyltransferase TrmO [Pseudomonadota bacterium]